MKSNILFTIITCLLIFVSGSGSFAQNGSVSTIIYKPGDKVEAEYTTWYPGKIIEILHNGDQYKVELYPPDGGKPFVYTFPKFRLRTPINTVNESEQILSNLKYGKYGCTASKYSGGSIEYIPRGSFTISVSGKYTYNGFQKPSNGSFIVDKAGNLIFKGGYLNGGKAEKIDRPNKFFLVFPANTDHRWTCGLAEE